MQNNTGFLQSCALQLPQQPVRVESNDIIQRASAVRKEKVLLSIRYLTKK